MAAAVARRLEGLAERAAGAEVAGGDDEGGVAGAPVVERGAQRRRGGVAGVVDEDDAGPGEEAAGAHGVGDRGGIAAEVGAGEAGQAHLGGAVGSDQRLDESGALQGDAHGVGAVEQDRGHPLVRAGEETGGVAAGELHGQPAAGAAQVAADSARRSTIWSARVTARRSPASRSAARLAKAELASSAGAL